MLHRTIKTGNDEIICAERLSSILFEKTFTKNFETKPVFFLKKELFFEKNSTSEMKKLLHPSEISVKC